jgi:hypothetical protein
MNIVFGVLLASNVLVGCGARLGVLLLAWVKGAGHDDASVPWRSTGQHPAELRWVVIGNDQLSGLCRPLVQVRGPRRQATGAENVLTTVSG